MKWKSKFKIIISVLFLLAALNSITSVYASNSVTSSTYLSNQNNHSNTQNSQGNQYTEKISIGLISSFVSATVAFILYYFNRRNIKKQIMFDISLKNLVPSVYIPLLKEYKLYLDRNENFRLREIEKVIIENAGLIYFSPAKVREILERLNSICKSITTEIIYKEKEEELKECFKELENYILNKFGEFTG